MERQLKIWHLILGLVVAGGGNLVAVGVYVGNQESIIKELRLRQDKHEDGMLRIQNDLNRLEKEGVQLIDLKLRIVRMEDKQDRTETKLQSIDNKLSEFIGELRAVRKP